MRAEFRELYGVQCVEINARFNRGIFAIVRLVVGGMDKINHILPQLSALRARFTFTNVNPSLLYNNPRPSVTNISNLRDARNNLLVKEG